MNEEQESPVNFATTGSDAIIDLNNIPGKKKLELIANGDMRPEAFIAPQNMPGKKLKELRDKHAAELEASQKRSGMNIPNEFKIGDMVQHRDKVYEVMEIDEKKGVLVNKIKKGETKKVWVHHKYVERA